MIDSRIIVPTMDIKSNSFIPTINMEIDKTRFPQTKRIY